ncbi:MAG TPA: hypothetical protein V6D12_07485 [Candidatus Obscuribacterales bacterium]
MASTIIRKGCWQINPDPKQWQYLAHIEGMYCFYDRALMGVSQFWSKISSAAIPGATGERLINTTRNNPNPWDVEFYRRFYQFRFYLCHPGCGKRCSSNHQIAQLALRQLVHWLQKCRYHRFLTPEMPLLTAAVVQ